MKKNLFPALRPGPSAISGASHQKHIPSSSLNITNVLTKALFCLLLTVTSALADGFKLEFSLETNPHVTVHLSPEQIIEVGRTRRLVLTQEQKEKLGYNLKNVPDVFGVESPREPTCSCCISPAMWTDTDKPKEENGKIAKTLQVMQLQRHGYPRTIDSCSPRG